MKITTILKTMAVVALLLTACDNKQSKPKKGGDSTSIPPTINVKYGGLYEGCRHVFDAFFCPESTRDGVLASGDDNRTVIYLDDGELKDLNETRARELLKDTNGS